MRSVGSPCSRESIEGSSSYASQWITKHSASALVHNYSSSDERHSRHLLSITFRADSVRASRLGRRMPVERLHDGDQDTVLPIVFQVRCETSIIVISAVDDHLTHVSAFPAGRCPRTVERDQNDGMVREQANTGRRLRRVDVDCLASWTATTRNSARRPYQVSRSAGEHGPCWARVRDDERVSGADPVLIRAKGACGRQIIPRTRPGPRTSGPGNNSPEERPARREHAPAAPAALWLDSAGTCRLNCPYGRALLPHRLLRWWQQIRIV